MSVSASISDPLMKVRLLFACVLAFLPMAAGLPTTQEALALAFPGAKIQRREHFLSEGQAQKAKALYGADLPGLWWVVYEARAEGRLLGVAFFDTHRVRTLNETAMVAVNADGALKRVEVVVFREPQEFLPKELWVRQLDGKRLNDDLSLKRSIRPLSGATLTANVLVDASRRSLALFQVLYGNSQ
jgi:electron transport complex protein RnfG